MNKKNLGALAWGLILAFVTCVHAAEYPERPITLMVPSIAGGGTDVGARILASIAEKKMGQPIVVVNKPGAGTQIGFTELSRQKPDGYYVGFVLLPAINTIISGPGAKGHLQHRLLRPDHQSGAGYRSHLGSGGKPL